MKKTILIMLALGATLICGLYAYKQGYISISGKEKKVEDIKSITGDFGELRVSTPDYKDTFSKAIYLNDTKLFENDHVGFQEIYPRQNKPELVIAWSDCGGSACGRASAIFIDLKSKPPVAELIPELMARTVKVEKVTSNEYFLTGTSSYITNEFGDLIPLKIKYKRDEKLLKFVPTKEGYYDYSKHAGKHPNDLLGNAQAREIFLRKMTSEEFKDFRHNVSVSTTTSTHHFGRYVTASGIAPHMGGDPSAFFAIDTLEDKFIVGTYKNGQITIVTDSKDGVVFYDAFNAFLDSHEMKWDYKQGRAIPLN